MGVIADNDEINIVIKKITSILSLNFSIVNSFSKDMEGNALHNSRVSANKNRGEEC